MKLTLIRKYRNVKLGYTIGELWIEGEKVCDTLEPNDIGLVNEAMPDKLTSEEWIRAKNDVYHAKQDNKKGTIAVPTGFYRLGVNLSSRFHARRLYLRNVPGFEGIMIHEGNTRKDTEGCILVGMNTIKAQVTSSRYWLKVVNDRVFAALDNKDTVILRITREYKK